MRQIADLHGWRTGGRGDPVVTRIPLGAAHTVLALLGPPTGALRPLGTASEVLLDLPVRTRRHRLPHDERHTADLGRPTRALVLLTRA